MAATFETLWAALRSVNELCTRLDALRGEQQPQLPDRAALPQLAGQFDKVWHHPAADHRICKRLERLLIEEIIATVNEAEPSIDLVIHWKGGKHTALKIAKNRTGQHSRATNRKVVEVVRELARRLPDGQIALILNRLGYQTGAGNGFTANRVVTLRYYHEIAALTRARCLPTLRSKKPPCCSASARERYGL